MYPLVSPYAGVSSVGWLQQQSHVWFILIPPGSVVTHNAPGRDLCMKHAARSKGRRLTSPRSSHPAVVSGDHPVKQSLKV